MLHVIQAITSGFLSQETADIKKQHEQLLKECGPTGSHTHTLAKFSQVPLPCLLQYSNQHSNVPLYNSVWEG